MQSHHFRGSRDQVCLHTGLLYVAKEKPISLCTVSSNLDHGPAAIWAQLEPILKLIKYEYGIEVVHFFSVGPSSQYKQKKNFYLLNKYVAKYFKWGTWNFFEANHGKGAADGIGAVVKRKADRFVATGMDISNAKQFFSVLKNSTSIKMYYIKDDDIKSVAETIPNDIPVLKGTMAVHQIATKDNG